MGADNVNFECEPIRDPPLILYLFILTTSHHAIPQKGKEKVIQIFEVGWAREVLLDKNKVSGSDLVVVRGASAASRSTPDNRSLCK